MMPPMEIALTMVGIGLTTFGIGFTIWSLKLKEVMTIARTIDSRLAALTAGFYAYQVEVEGRLSRLETATHTPFRTLHPHDQ